jgi:ectoine hydroxylase-related dioxygenase (phytanoyl-CoA dioxygenase family)
VFTGAFPDPSVVDRASAVFAELIAEQKASGVAAGDHFATPGANDRVWGALDKLALRAPEVFADYYANDVLALVSEAWLGPGYQSPRRSTSSTRAGRRRSRTATTTSGSCRSTSRWLPGAGAPALPADDPAGRGRATATCRCETGPTMYLPHSQKYPPGTSPSTSRSSPATSTGTYVQLPLAKGDAAFFNPALFHGAGTNRSADVRRMANLLQVSSAFGRAMESVDRVAMSLALYPVLARRRAAGAGERELRNVVGRVGRGRTRSPPTSTGTSRSAGWRRRRRRSWSGRALRDGWDARRVRRPRCARTPTGARPDRRGQRRRVAAAAGRIDRPGGGGRVRHAVLSVPAASRRMVTATAATRAVASAMPAATATCRTSTPPRVAPTSSGDDGRPAHRGCCARRHRPNRDSETSAVIAMVSAIMGMSGTASRRTVETWIPIANASSVISP